MSVVEQDNVQGDEWGAFPQEPTVWRVNEYEVTREYGGPEEGGWWYNLHRPTGSSIVLTGAFEAREVWDVAHDLNAFANVENKNSNPRGIYSVIGGADIRWVAENHEPCVSPATTPHYA